MLLSFFFCAFCVVTDRKKKKKKKVRKKERAWLPSSSSSTACFFFFVKALFKCFFLFSLRIAVPCSIPILIPQTHHQTHPAAGGEERGRRAGKGLFRPRGEKIVFVVDVVVDANAAAAAFRREQMPSAAPLVECDGGERAVPLRAEDKDAAPVGAGACRLAENIEERTGEKEQKTLSFFFLRFVFVFFANAF